MKRILLLALASALPLTTFAQLYSENFDVDNTANWTVNKGLNPTGSTSNFFFDYSTYGIVSAPGSGGTTRGLRLDANVANGIFSGQSVSPNGPTYG